MAADHGQEVAQSAGGWVARSGRSVLLVVAPAAVVLLAAASVLAGTSLVFREAAAFRAAGAVTAVAVDGRGRIAAGTDRGVWLSEGGGAARRILASEGVHDLLFTAPGRLFVASDRGIYRIAAGGGAVQSAPGPGAARRVRRLAAGAGVLLAATEAGLFCSRDGRVWERLDGALPRATVVAVAALAAPGAAGLPDLVAVLDGALYRIALRSTPTALAVASARRLTLAQGQAEVVDLAPAPEPGALYVLGPRSLSVLTLPEGRERRSRRLALPSGARAQRLIAVDGRVWVATDHGLVSVAGLQGGVTRAPGPPGTAAATALAVSGSELFVAGSRGLWVGRPETSAAGGAAADGRQASAADPSIVAVQQATLRYLDLGPERLRELRRGVDRRGWLPTLEIDGGWGGTRQWGAAQDETFTYGSLHHLGGSDWDRKRSFDVGATLRWDLGDIVYSSDALDVSKEARAVIELRDEVLDQVEQLYFERRRVLLQIASLPGAGGPEARRLRIRAQELGAGLDAWTGGWWSRALAATRNVSPPGPAPETTP